jgi:hypothetical protein
MATTKIKALLIIFKWDINKNGVLHKGTYLHTEFTSVSLDDYFTVINLEIIADYRRKHFINITFKIFWFFEF